MITRPPVETELVHGQPGTRVTSPNWLQWFQQIWDGRTQMTGLTTYADNTAALAGGLVAGDIYKTAAGVVMVVY